MWTPHPAFERRRRARLVADAAARLAAAFADDPHADPAEDTRPPRPAAAPPASTARPTPPRGAAYDALRDVHPDRAAAELHRDDRALGPEEIRALTNDLGIVPREVTQRRGDAMFVPASASRRRRRRRRRVAVSVACLAHASLPAALRATRAWREG